MTNFNLDTIDENIKAIELLVSLEDLSVNDPDDKDKVEAIVAKYFTGEQIVEMAEVRIARVNERALTNELGVTKEYAEEFETKARDSISSLLRVGYDEIYNLVVKVEEEERRRENEEFDRVEDMSDEERFDYLNPNWRELDELAEAAMERQIEKHNTEPDYW